MATDKKTSALIQSQVPEYLREEGPNLVAFLKAYYEWMETSGQVTDESKNLLANQDIDTTNLNKFYEYFRREVLALFPQNVLADKRLLTKKIKDLYRSKGSPLSYKLLFRILYNEEITLFNPAEYILKTSDGRWEKHAFIRLGPPFVGNLDNMNGQFVTGQASGARGKVIEVITARELGIEIKQITITDIVGEFEDRERVVSDNGLSGEILAAIGPLAGVTFDDLTNNRGGSGHQLGDTVALNSPTGFNAKGVVTGTTNGAVTFDLLDGGSGYRANSTIVYITGGSGVGGSVSVNSISNLETLNLYTDRIDYLANTSIGFGPSYGTSANTNTLRASANLESANVNTALNAALGLTNEVVGTINSISVTTGNYNVNLPEVVAEDKEIFLLDIGDGSGGKKGRNARIRARFIPGSITSLDVTAGGQSYSSIYPVTVVNETRTATNGSGTPVITGILEDPGRYVESKGFLSWDMKLQDSYYYQEYSYVINSDVGLRTYRDIVHQVLHPAGTKLFGTMDLSSTIDYAPQYDIESFTSVDLIRDKDDDGDELVIPSTLAFGDIETARTLPVGSLPSALTFGNTVVGMIANLQSLTSSVSVPPMSVQYTITPPAITPTELNPFGDMRFNLNVDPSSIAPVTTYGSNTFVLLDGEGTIFVNGNNVISAYLSTPITTLLSEPAWPYGSSGQVLGTNTTFETILQSGSIIEITDIDPGEIETKTYIVDTVFSNTMITITPTFGDGTGATMANGIFKYVYDGNI